jgi:hypothetical protein
MLVKGSQAKGKDLNAIFKESILYNNDNRVDQSS